MLRRQTGYESLGPNPTPTGGTSNMSDDDDRDALVEEIATALLAAGAALTAAARHLQQRSLHETPRAPRQENDAVPP